jgi:hypothetical protein
MSKSYILPENPEELIRECLNVATKSWVDQLDCSVSWARQRTNLTVEEVLKIALEDKRTFWSFIYREGGFIDETAHWEIGCRTISGEIDYFLWVELDFQVGNNIINKYHLCKY